MENQQHIKATSAAATGGAIASPLWQRFAEALNRWASLEGLLIAWFCLTPVASFYFRFPTDRSLITFDRSVFALVGLLLFTKYLAAYRLRQPAMRVTKFEIVWALLAALVLSSALLSSHDLGFALRVAVDAFALPLVVFHAARYHFNLRGRESQLFFAAVALAFLLFATGAYEYRTGINVFAYKGSELVRDGELRANGPFLADTSYVIICLLVTLLLRLLPRLLNLKFDRSARLLYVLALAAAAAATLIPLFRTAALTLALCWLLVEALLLVKPARDGSFKLRDLALRVIRSKRLGVYLTTAVFLFVAFTAWQELSGGASFARRLTSPRNALGRLATWQTATRIALENPVFGVGLMNYTDYFDQKFADWRQQRDALADTRAANTPHSNLFWMFAEFGAVGLLLYLLAFGYLARLGYDALQSATSAQQVVASGGLLVLIVAYTVPGLTLQSGIYWDLNLYFFFLLGLLSNKSLVADL